MIQCAIYTRSATSDTLGMAVERELVRTCILARSGKGVSVLPDRYEDSGASGNTTDRPELRRLMADVAAGKVGFVAVRCFARLARDPAVLAELLSFFRSHGVEVVSTTENFDPTIFAGEGGTA